MAIDGPVQAFLAKGKKTKPLISVDVDNTIAFFSQHVLAVINDRFATQYTLEDWILPGGHWITDPAQSAFFHTLHENAEFKATMAPDYAGIAAVWAIRDAGFDVAITSSRPESMLQVTKDWLKRYDCPLQQVSVGPRAKEQLSRNHNKDHPVLFVDDNPHLINDVNRPGSQLYW